MANYDVQLLELKEKAERAAKLRELLELMKRQRSSLTYAASRAQRKQQEEQADVDRMKSGISGFFSRLSGNYEARMDQEVSECLEASMELTQAQQELKELKAQQAAYQQELEELLPFEEAYHTRIRTLYEELKSSGTPEGTQAVVLEERLNTVVSQLARLRIALQECQNLEGKAGDTMRGLVMMQTQYEQQRTMASFNDYRHRRRSMDQLREELLADQQNAALGIQVPMNRLYQELSELQVEEAEILEMSVGEGNVTEARVRLSHAEKAVAEKIAALEQEEQELRQRLDAISEGIAQRQVEV